MMAADAAVDGREADEAPSLPRHRWPRRLQAPLVTMATVVSMVVIGESWAPLHWFRAAAGKRRPPSSSGCSACTSATTLIYADGRRAGPIALATDGAVNVEAANEVQAVGSSWMRGADKSEFAGDVAVEDKPPSGRRRRRRRRERAHRLRWNCQLIPILLSYRRELPLV